MSEGPLHDLVTVDIEDRKRVVLLVLAAGGIDPRTVAIHTRGSARALIGAVSRAAQRQRQLLFGLLPRGDDALLLRADLRVRSQGEPVSRGPGPDERSMMRRLFMSLGVLAGTLAFGVAVPASAQAASGRLSLKFQEFRNPVRVRADPEGPQRLRLDP